MKEKTLLPTKEEQLNTTLMRASNYGYLEVVKLLLEHGADVHAHEDEALKWASMNGHTEVVKLLLEHGADVHACEDEALKSASVRGYVEIVKLLREHKVLEKNRIAKEENPSLLEQKESEIETKPSKEPEILLPLFALVSLVKACWKRA